MLCGISSRFQLLSPTERQVPHALLTRSPLSRKPKLSAPFDLHVLGTPPAFVLSQDQTLKNLYLKLIEPQIKFLNNLLLAFITQEFRWLFFRLRLNNPLIVQGVSCSSLRYSIYKVQVPSRDSFMILSYSLPFVNLFLQIFHIFFAYKKSGPKPRFLSAIILYHRSSRNRRRSSYTPQRRYRHCPRPGRQRTNGSADSSA